jgi:putative component of membrane protein insertase Oxa1/YidC/SpoIIIJ protein YidD
MRFSIQKAVPVITQNTADPIFREFMLFGFFIFIFFSIIGCSTLPSPVIFSTETCADDEFSPLSEMIQFYQGPMDHFTAVRFGECPMFPNCSEYGRDAIHTHGVMLGWFMTCDRLMRCGRDELTMSPEIIIDGKLKTFDPVNRNDQWLQNSLFHP